MRMIFPLYLVYPWESGDRQNTVASGLSVEMTRPFSPMVYREKCGVVIM